MTVKNIHIRYEDRITNPGTPFSLGITLSDLIVESTDENWKRAIVDDISKIYKVCITLHYNHSFKCRVFFLLDCPIGRTLSLLELQK